MVQFPKSKADIPFLSCSSGFILSEDKITAIKSEPLIILDSLTYDVILFIIWFLNSVNVVFFSNDFGKFISTLWEKLPCEQFEVLFKIEMIVLSYIIV